MMRVLSPVEEAYLSGTRDFTKAKQRYIRYRLKKKLRLLYESRDATAAGLLRRLDNDNDSLVVGQPGRANGNSSNNIIDNESSSPSRDLDPGPKVSASLPPSFRNEGGARDYETFALPG
jgi:hypothetical protein